MMFYARSKRANRMAGFVMLALGALGMASSSWLKHALQLPEGHMANAVDFASGLVLGLGISFVLVGFSSDMECEE